MSVASATRLATALVAHLSAACLVGLVIVAAGQPIFTDDLWWHLAMGGEYWANGPWLDADAFLFAAERPPEPAAWLTGAGLHGVHALGGFQALRVLHVVFGAAILGLAWRMLRRVGGSPIAASLFTAVLAALAAYRFFQLRPPLVSVLAALVIVRLLVVDRRPPTPGRIAASAAVIALWANAHGAFVLGLVLIGAALAGAVAEVLWRGGVAGRDWSRVRGLGIALGAAVLAGCLNPAGPRFLLLYFVAGTDTPDLAVVADEWAPLRLFSMPLVNVPPSPLSWALVWALLVAMPLAVALHARADRRFASDGPDAESSRLDLALVAVAFVSLAGALAAVRLSWLGVFAALAVVHALPAIGRMPRAQAAALTGRVLAAATTAALVPAFLQVGAWQMISRGVHSATYGEPYSTSKYHAHGVWMLGDAGLEGRVWNDYWHGNFLGYWLAPRLRVFVNGSLNVPKQVMQAAGDIRRRRTDAAGRTTPELLDLYGVDVFVGTGAPLVANPGRPHPDTTRHLERTPGWLPIFRNLQTALYLRTSEANRSNLQRIEDWYAGQGVPFDRTAGFDPSRAIEEARAWSVAHGLIPPDYEQLRRSAGAGPVEQRRAAQERLASIDLMLGLYDRAVERDTRLAAAGSTATRASRRMVWSLLHAGRFGEALEAAERLALRAAPDDALSLAIVKAARTAATAPDHRRAEILARLPVFTRPQGRWVTSGFVSAEPRSGRS